ncbi:unnamed protein product, partial [Ectocarpus sp. 13 AM-2016]
HCQPHGSEGGTPTRTAGVFLRGYRDRAVGRPHDLQNEVAVHPDAGHDQLGDELRALLRDAPCGLVVLLPAHQRRARDEKPPPRALVPGHALFDDHLHVRRDPQVPHAYHL